RLENTDDTEVEILLIAPVPTLVDELGNVLSVSSRTGIGRCDRYGKWTSNARNCSAVAASRLVQGVPITVSVGFAPKEGSYTKELAELSNVVSARLHFVFSTDGFKTSQVNEVIIPDIPLPKSK
ncbi:MAG: hypothetical protein AAFX85_19490, partial [Pseudomonadota bacterium]